MRYFHHFLLPSTENLLGHNAFLPDMYFASTSKTQYLRDAVRAVSLAHFTTTGKLGDKHLPQARRAYGSALQGLRGALEAGDSAALGDAALMTASLLWTYDVS